MRSTERVWRKRKIHIKDIQRTIGLMKKAAEVKGRMDLGLALANYGQGRIFLEYHCDNLRDGGSSPPIDEYTLRGDFSNTLDMLWTERSHA